MVKLRVNLMLSCTYRANMVARVALSNVSLWVKSLGSPSMKSASASPVTVPLNVKLPFLWKELITFI